MNINELEIGQEVELPLHCNNHGTIYYVDRETNVIYVKCGEMDIELDAEDVIAFYTTPGD